MVQKEASAGLVPLDVLRGDPGLSQLPVAACSPRHVRLSATSVQAHLRLHWSLPSPRICVSSLLLPVSDLPLGLGPIPRSLSPNKVIFTLPSGYHSIIAATLFPEGQAV